MLFCLKRGSNCFQRLFIMLLCEGFVTGSLAPVYVNYADSLMWLLTIVCV